MKKNNNFWFITGATIFVFIYLFAITFFPIPESNNRFVDIILGFLPGTVVGGAFASITGKKNNHSKENQE